MQLSKRFIFSGPSQKINKSVEPGHPNCPKACPIGTKVFRPEPRYRQPTPWDLPIRQTVERQVNVIPIFAKNVVCVHNRQKRNVPENTPSCNATKQLEKCFGLKGNRHVKKNPAQQGNSTSHALSLVQVCFFPKQVTARGSQCFLKVFVCCGTACPPSIRFVSLCLPSCWSLCPPRLPSVNLCPFVGHVSFLFPFVSLLVGPCVRLVSLLFPFVSLVGSLLVGHCVWRQDRRQRETRRKTRRTQ